MSKRLEVVVEGTGDPILLVNGLIHDLTTWNYYAKVLSRSNTVIRFDFPNQGRSFDELANISVDRQAEVIVEILEGLNIDSRDVIVLAQSSGASITRHLHCNLGYDFKGIVLFGVNPGGLHGFYSQLYKGYLDILQNCGVSPYYRAIAPMLFSPLFFEDNPDALEQIISTCESTYSGRMDALIALVRQPFFDHTLENPPSRFRSKTLVLHGDLDYLVPGKKRDEYYQKCKAGGALTRVIDGGHCFAFEDPVSTLTYVKQFLSEHVDQEVSLA